MTTMAQSKVNPGIPLRPLLSLISIAMMIHFAMERSQVQSELKEAMEKLNNSVHATKEFLFFNRVPKVGSQTIMNLLKELQVMSRDLIFQSQV